MVRKRLADKRSRLSNGSSTNTGKNILSRAVCPHCGQKHPRKLICDISDYLRVVHNLRELLHEGQFSCPVVACSHCGTVYADRPAAMPVPYSHAAGCQASADLVIEYANMMACGILMHRSDVICGSDTVDQLATENFGRPVQTWATEGIGCILTEQIKAVARQAEYIGADETKLPVLEKDSESGTVNLLVCSTDPEQDRPFVVYEYMPSRQGESIAAHLKNWKFRVLTRDGYEDYTAALREQSLETRDITTQVCLVHARRRICNAVNVDHFEDFATQNNGAELAASRFEEHPPQYLLCMALTALTQDLRLGGNENPAKG